MSVWVLSGVFAWFSIDLCSSPEDLVLASALLWAYLTLGPTPLILAGTVSYVGAGVIVWVLSGVFYGLWFLSWGNKGPFLRNFSRGPPYYGRRFP